MAYGYAGERLSEEKWRDVMGDTLKVQLAKKEEQLQEKKEELEHAHNMIENLRKQLRTASTNNEQKHKE